MYMYLFTYTYIHLHTSYFQDKNDMSAWPQFSLCINCKRGKYLMGPCPTETVNFSSLHDRETMFPLPVESALNCQHHALPLRPHTSNPAWTANLSVTDYSG